ncbi:ECF transporter S component [Tyzzerella sp. OttesenSCG-928-J15]|nr:ECF transporter S component [Tyzzerella sp. OttesenSCG-928-J15]
MKNRSTKNLVLAGICLAFCVVLPFFTGQIPAIGKVISPMHIPALLCGFLCGWPYALVVGFIAPLLRYLMFGMPPMPSALIMAVELAAYGFFSSVIYNKLPKNTVNIYISLIAAMLGGRVVWGVASFAVYTINGSGFTFAAFLAGAFTKAIPAIIIHILLIPVIVMGLKRAGIIENA